MEKFIVTVNNALAKITFHVAERGAGLARIDWHKCIISAYRSFVVIYPQLPSSLR